MGNRSTEGFFKNQVGLALTTSFQKIEFGFLSTKISLFNDSGAIIEYSINGTTVHGALFAGESREMGNRALTQIHLRGAAGGEAYRLEVY